MGENERVLDFLQNGFNEPIRDPVWKHIYVSRELLRIIELPAFQKLGRIKQLGPACLVYPGATHTRLSHSLGVLHIARRMVTGLARRGRQDGTAAAILDLDGVKAFLCAALLHDIGHFPYAHSLKDLPVEAHEALTAREILGGLAAPIRSALGVAPEEVASIIDPRGAGGGEARAGFYAKILSGVLDPDKIDYLTRDAFFCGVPYGIQDVDFILEETYPHPQTGVAVSRKGTTALENVLFSKYLMYKTVYWHKTVRIATAMIKKAIALGLEAGAISREDLYGLDDEEFLGRFGKPGFPGYQLIEDVRRRQLYKQVERVPFRAESALHRSLERVPERLRLEERLAGEASRLLGRPVSPQWIIIDLPERISFDMEITLRDDDGREGLSLLSSAHLFAGLDTEDMPGSLRCVSVSARRDPGLLDVLARMDVTGSIEGP